MAKTSGQTGCLDRKHLIAAGATLILFMGNKRGIRDRALQLINLHVGKRKFNNSTGRDDPIGKTVIAQPFIDQSFDVDISDGPIAVKIEALSLGKNLPIFCNQRMTGKDQISRRLPGPAEA